MVLKLSDALAFDLVTRWSTQLDLGSSNAAARILIYDGTEPATPDTALSGNNELVSILMQNPAYLGVVDNGDLIRAVAATTGSPGVVGSGTVAISGTATFYRVVDRDNNVQWQGSVVASGGGTGNLTLSQVGFTVGDTVSISNFAIQMSQTGL